MDSFESEGRTLIRFIARVSEPVEGHFRFRDVIQLSPVPANAPEHKRNYASHPFVLEYAFDTRDATSLTSLKELAPEHDVPPEGMIKADYHWAKQQEIVSLLSVVSRHLVDLEGARDTWLLESGEYGGFGQTEYSFRSFRQLGAAFSPQSADPMHLLGHEEYFATLSGIDGCSFSLSESAPSLLDRYFRLSPECREAFLSASVLLRQALKTYPVSNSLAYVGVVSALEALVQFEHRDAAVELCATCGQERYRVMRKFRDFIETYGPPGVHKKLIVQLYKRRSGIGHVGALLATDIAGRLVSLRNEGEAWSEWAHLLTIARYSCVEWLLKRTSPDLVASEA